MKNFIYEYKTFLYSILIYFYNILKKEYECCICNLKFTNRFSWLKHKYFHSASSSVNNRSTTSMLGIEDEEVTDNEFRFSNLKLFILRHYSNNF